MLESSGPKLEQIGPYRIVSRLGSGGMGEVYRASDTRLGREVAIKVLLATVASDPERIGRFRREARVAASLNHPNIAAIYGFEDFGESHFLVMELYQRDNGSTDRWLMSARVTPSPSAISAAAPVELMKLPSGLQLSAFHPDGQRMLAMRPVAPEYVGDRVIEIVNWLDQVQAKASGR